MAKPFIRRPMNWMLFVGLLVGVFALSACGGSSSTSTSSTTASPATQSNAMTSAATVTIKEQTGTQDVYSFSPASVTIKAGDAVTFDNQSDEFHLLIPTDAMGTPITATDPFTANTIVPTSRASSTTTLQVVFNKAGTYYYTSKLVNRLKDNAHPEGALSQGKGTIVVS
jgi:plastocyanin